AAAWAPRSLAAELWARRTRSPAPEPQPISRKSADFSLLYLTRISHIAQHSAHSRIIRGNARQTPSGASLLREVFHEHHFVLLFVVEQLVHVRLSQEHAASAP